MDDPIDGYQPRWSLFGHLFVRGLDESVPWVAEIDRARQQAANAARDAVFAAHRAEFRRCFDEEMDRRHAEIVAAYAEQLDLLRNDPDFNLRSPT